MRVLIGLIGLTVVGALSVQAPVAKPVASPAAPAGDAVNGKKIYVSYGCYQCHNYAANGGVAGARLAPHPLAFADFSRYVRRPTGEMPPYTPKVVTDKEIADIYAFLLTIPAPPSPGTIAILK
jgi:mono/diheme cytochrome c family protein